MAGAAMPPSGGDNGHRVRGTFLIVPCVAMLTLFVSSGHPHRVPSDKTARGGPVIMQQAPADSSKPVKARVRFEFSGTQRSGATGLPRIAFGDMLAVGETMTRFAATGDGAGGDVCDFHTVTEPSAQHTYTWRLDVRLVSIEAGRSIAELSWSRSRPSGGVLVPVREDTRLVTLGPRETHTIDYVENQGDASCTAAMVSVSIQPESPATALRLTAELWAVVEDEGGFKRSGYQRVVGDAGQEIPFDLPALGVPVERPGSADGALAELQIAVKGTLHIKPLDEGGAEVEVRATRTLSHNGASTGGGGSAQFTAPLAHTVAIELPRPLGRLRSPLPAQGRHRLLPGVTVRDGGLDIDSARLLEPYDVSLHVRVSTGTAQAPQP